jgi:hypothetical protein
MEDGRSQYPIISACKSRKRENFHSELLTGHKGEEEVAGKSSLLSCHSVPRISVISHSVLATSL